MKDHIEVTTKQTEDVPVIVSGSLSDSEGYLMKHQNLSQKQSASSSCLVKKMYPSKLELSTINNLVPCTENNCQEIFTSQSNLNLHLYKTHRKKDAIKFESVIKQFHCPEIQCIYHEEESFKNKKLLKQHYLKIHTPKNYKCETCNQGFPNESFKNRHVDYCGVIFKCNDCPITYPKYESLMTHARRKDHEINEKTAFKLPPKPRNRPIICVSKSESNLVTKMRTLVPKLSSSVQLVILSKSGHNRNDQGIQTDQITSKLKSKLTQINRSSFNKDTRQTQTIFLKDQLTSETQTIGDFLKPNNVGKIDNQKKFSKIQTSTQTNNVSLKSVSSNTFLDVTDLNIPQVEVKRSSSSTQTMVHPPDEVVYSSTTNTHDSIHTDTSDLISNNLENFDTNFFNCNMETQTDQIFTEDLFSYCDYYSNMYTQTCEDMLLDSLELNNIETQTMDEMLRSVESQTMIYQTKKPQTSCRDISHMETQTDMEFKQMLEAINA